jgi:hypothetical protein
MPESDRAELRRRNKLSCPETIDEISHIARGDRDSATTFAGVLDPLRGVIGSATLSLIATVSASSPDTSPNSDAARWAIRQLDLHGPSVKADTTMTSRFFHSLGVIRRRVQSSIGIRSDYLSRTKTVKARSGFILGI